MSECLVLELFLYGAVLGFFALNLGVGIFK